MVWKDEKSCLLFVAGHNIQLSISYCKIIKITNHYCKNWTWWLSAADRNEQSLYQQILAILKHTITGELTCRWKNFCLLPLEPQISCLCGDLVAAVQQHFAMTKQSLSYSDLKGHCVSPTFKLRTHVQTHQKPEKIQ